MKIGVMVQLFEENDVARKFSDARAMGFDNCQLVIWERPLLNKTVAENVKAAAQEYGIEITAFWCGWEGPRVWDLYDGQLTLGLCAHGLPVPPHGNAAGGFGLCQNDRR